VHCSTHMICSSMPIASTQLTFFYTSCRKKITTPPFGTPSAGAQGHMPSASLFAATAKTLPTLHSSHPVQASILRTYYPSISFILDCRFIIFCNCLTRWSGWGHPPYVCIEPEIVDRALSTCTTSLYLTTPLSFKPRRRSSPGTISVKFCIDVSGWLGYKMALKHCRKF